MEPIDDISLGVYRDKLVSVCDQMTNTLARTSFSPILREAYDLSVGITDREGRLVAEATNSLPNFTRFLSQATKNMVAEFGHDGLEAGDVLASNDPWSETTHQYDIAIIRPVFWDGEVVAFTSGMGHLSDIGGRPYTAHADSTFEEGLVIPPTKLVRGGDLNDDVVDILRANVRVPDEVMGDVKAFLSSTYTGAREITRFIDDTDEPFEAICEEILAKSRDNVVAAIRELPTGTYRESMAVDGIDGPIRIDCEIAIGEETIHVDYDGTADQVPYSLNVPKLYTDSYTAYAIKSVTTPNTRETDGDFEPISISAPEGSILNPRYPAAIAGRALIGHHCAVITNRVMAQVVPEMTMADPGMTMTSQLNSEGSTGEQYSVMLFCAGGGGATARKDGEPTLSLPTNITSISIETLEEKTGNLRFLEKRLRQDSGGPGEYRGGLGQRLRVKNTGDRPVTVSFIGRRGDFPAPGLEGGRAGLSQHVEIDGERVPVKSEQTIDSQAVVTYLEAGGGGFGDPARRDTERVRRDLENGYISPEHAREHYQFDDVDEIDRP